MQCRGAGGRGQTPPPPRAPSSRRAPSWDVLLCTPSLPASPPPPGVPARHGRLRQPRGGGGWAGGSFPLSPCMHGLTPPKPKRSPAPRSPAPPPPGPAIPKEPAVGIKVGISLGPGWCEGEGGDTHTPGPRPLLPLTLASPPRSAHGSFDSLLPPPGPYTWSVSLCFTPPPRHVVGWAVPPPPHPLPPLSQGLAYGSSRYSTLPSRCCTWSALALPTPSRCQTRGGRLPSTLVPPRAR